MRVLIWVTHTLRTQSKLFSRATACNEVSFVYYSPYYYDDDYRLIQKNTKTDIEYFFRYGFSVFSNTLEELGYSLSVFKEEDPVAHINTLIEMHGYDKVIIDKPLFNFPNSIDVKKINCKIEFVDSDIYDPSCKEMDPKNRTQYWIENYIEYGNIVSSTEAAQGINLVGEKFQLLDKNASFDLGESDPTVNRFLTVMAVYNQTKLKLDGTFRVSGHLQHGIIDQGILVYQILTTSLYDRIDGEIWHLEPLRKLAKREIDIIKARSFGLQPYDDVLEWAELILDKDSIINLTEVTFPAEFTKMQVFEELTPNNNINEVVKMLKDQGWMHNLLRKWIASKIYYGIGGGPEALETIIELFNRYSADGMSPSNIINSVESLRLIDGEVPKFDTEDIFSIVGM
tara:strand:- start:2087 stop:3280 length:1194 start_codon:yes stop_codon:yes gene_type:complete